MKGTALSESRRDRFGEKFDNRNIMLYFPLFLIYARDIIIPVVNFPWMEMKLFCIEIV